MTMITIDGSQGEGGGQILRTALALSLVTRTPFRIDCIRTRRKKPGLMRQHLTAVKAAAEVGRASLSGAAIGSQRLTFEPTEITPGSYHFAVGTAGSATLVLQTVLPALMLAPGPSTLMLEGGTHNPYAPPFDFLQRSFIPLVNRMGPQVAVELDRPGFYPAGGGRFRVTVEPASALSPLDLLERGPIRRQSARALVAKLPRHIAERELRVIGREFDWPEEDLTIEEVGDATGPGNAVMIEIEGEHVTEVFTGFGQRGVRAEAVAAQAAEQCDRYLSAGVPVGPYLADQLLLPLALAGGGSFKTLPPTDHSKTNAETIQRFLDVNVAVEELRKKEWLVTVSA